MKPFEFSEFFNLGKLIEQPYFSVNTFSEFEKALKQSLNMGFSYLFDKAFVCQRRYNFTSFSF